MYSVIRNVRVAAAAAFVALCSAALPTVAHGGEAGQSWDFRVFLDDKEIGTHRFDLVGQGEQRQLTSKARMAVKILFVTAYTYDHHDVEHWQGDCLDKLTSKTDDNGEKHHVDVERRDGKTIVRTERAIQSYGPCTLTFAYWNPVMLRQTQLLNSQDGEYIDVKITDAGADSILVRGVKTPARRFELRSKKLSIDLWYSQQDEWLQLESKTERGQKLIYKLR